MPIEVNQKTEKGIFEKFMLVFATIEPLATLPQIYQIWSDKNTTGVSLTTWAFYAITSAVWFAYGLKTKDKPIIISGLLWVITQSLVVVGILVH